VDTPPEDKKPEHPLAKLSPDQFRTLLASDLGRTSARANAGAQSKESSRRRLFWAGVILLAGLLYVIFRFTTAPSKVIVVNTSGEDAASVIVASGDQLVDLGSLGNGEVRRVELVPGKPLQVEYSFGSRHVWTDPQPMGAFQSVTIFIGMGGKVRAVREAPWARTAEQPAIQRPAAR
jgi:hypothetical protein